MKSAIKGLLIAVVAAVVISSAAYAQATRTAIAIYTSPGGGIVYLDGQRLGPAPVTDWATNLGMHKLTIKVNDQVVLSKEINVKNAGGQKFTFNLPAPKKKPAAKAKTHK